MSYFTLSCPECGAAAVERPAWFRVEQFCLRCRAHDRQVRYDQAVSEPDRVDASYRFKHPVSGRRIDHVLRVDRRRRDGRIVIVERVVDRHDDWYYELILDPEDGTVLRESAHLLSLHRGHGAATGTAAWDEELEAGLELAVELKNARGELVAAAEVRRHPETRSLERRMWDRSGQEIDGLPHDARGLVVASTGSANTCDLCAQTAVFVSRRGRGYEALCGDHLFVGSFRAPKTTDRAPNRDDSAF